MAYGTYYAPGIQPNLARILRDNGLSAHIENGRDNYYLVVSTVNSPVVKYNLSPQQMNAITHTDGFTGGRLQTGYNTLASIISGDFKIPDSFIAANNVNSRCNMGQQGIRFWNSYREIPIYSPWDPYSGGLPFFLGWGFRGLDYRYACGPYSGLYPGREDGQLAPGEIRPMGGGFYWKGTSHGKRYANSQQVAEKREEFQVAQAAPVERTFGKATRYKDVIQSMGATNPFTKDVWNEVLKTHGIEIDQQARSLSIRSRGADTDMLYQISQEDIDKILDNDGEKISPQARLDIINKKIAPDFKEPITMDMLNSDEMIGIEAVPEATRAYHLKQPQTYDFDADGNRIEYAPIAKDFTVQKTGSHISSATFESRLFTEGIQSDTLDRLNKDLDKKSLPDMVSELRLGKLLESQYAGQPLPDNQTLQSLTITLDGKDETISLTEEQLRAFQMAESNLKRDVNVADIELNASVLRSVADVSVIPDEKLSIGITPSANKTDSVGSSSLDDKEKEKILAKKKEAEEKLNQLYLDAKAGKFPAYDHAGYNIKNWKLASKDDISKAMRDFNVTPKDMDDYRKGDIHKKAEILSKYVDGVSVKGVATYIVNGEKRTFDIDEATSRELSGLKSADQYKKLIALGDVRDYAKEEPMSYTMTADIDGQKITREISERDYASFMAGGMSRELVTQKVFPANPFRPEGESLTQLIGSNSEVVGVDPNRLMSEFKGEGWFMECENGREVALDDITVRPIIPIVSDTMVAQGKNSDGKDIYLISANVNGIITEVEMSKKDYEKYQKKPEEQEKLRDKYIPSAAVSYVMSTVYSSIGDPNVAPKKIDIPLSEKDYNKFLRVNDFQRMKMFSKLCPEIEMKGPHNNLGDKIIAGLLVAPMAIGMVMGFVDGMRGPCRYPYRGSAMTSGMFISGAMGPQMALESAYRQGELHGQVDEALRHRGYC